MIDLTSKDLPNTIVVNGKSILLNTDFRIWIIVYNNLMEKKDIELDNIIINKDIILTDDEFLEFRNELFKFAINPNETPNYKNSNDVKVFDYILDGEYIYSAFMKVYGIDLLEEDMHWHKFKALCDDLTYEKSTTFEHAKRARTYRKPSKNDTEEKYWKTEHEAWSFPVKLTEKELQEISKKEKEFNDYFG